MKRTPRQIEVLVGMVLVGMKPRGSEPNPWLRPMDIGAQNASRRSSVMARLVTLGLLERRLRNSPATEARSPRGSYEYRLTDAGLDALSEPAGVTCTCGYCSRPNNTRSEAIAVYCDGYWGGDGGIHFFDGRECPPPTPDDWDGVA